MNDNSPDDMDPDRRLDALIQRLARESVPPAPGNLESCVWREIRTRRSREQRSSGNAWFSRILGLWQESRVAVAGALAAVAIGIAMSWSAAAVPAHTASTRQALDLGVFSAEAPFLPSTLLARADSNR